MRSRKESTVVVTTRVKPFVKGTLRAMARQRQAETQRRVTLCAVTMTVLTDAAITHLGPEGYDRDVKVMLSFVRELHVTMSYFMTRKVVRRAWQIIKQAEEMERAEKLERAA
jgi:hypothetical protein